MTQRLSLIGFYLTILLSGITTLAESPAPSLRVMSFNVRYNTPRDGDWAWPYRKDLVAKLIQQNNIDILGVQETTLDMLEDLNPHLSDYSWVGEDRQGDSQGEYNAIFYRHDLFELKETNTFWLSKTPEVPGSTSWGTGTPRIATWAHLTHKATQTSYVILNTHFDPFSSEARKQSARLIRNRLIDKFKEQAVIIMGDFNDTTRAAFYDILHESGHIKDSRVHTKTPHIGPSWTFRGFWGFFKRRLDFIFVSPHLKVNSHSYLVDLGPGDTPPSDHLPVLIELEPEAKQIRAAL